MSQYLIYLIAAGVIIAAFWIAIRSAMSEAKKAGAAESRAKASEEARKAEQEMADEIVTPITNEEVKDKLRKGDI